MIFLFENVLGFLDGVLVVLVGVFSPELGADESLVLVAFSFGSMPNDY